MHFISYRGYRYKEQKNIYAVKYGKLLDIKKLIRKIDKKKLYTIIARYYVLMENKVERTALTIDQKIQITEYALEKKQVTEPLLASLLFNMAVP